VNALFANVIYMGVKAGVVYWDENLRTAAFEYTPDFLKNGVELAPLKMPLRPDVYQFANLHESYSGLPGMLADCLPDTYGNALINEWLRRQQRSPNVFSPVERLCYIGDRGMGALEFRPSTRPRSSKAEIVHIDKLIELASMALANKSGLSTQLCDEESLSEILRVGTSAGGARAKAVIALNPVTNEIRSGQAVVPSGFEHWLLKFDGVSSSFDGVKDPQGYGRIEYAYHLMAKDAGMNMTHCRLFEEGGRAHFMTRRFDRTDDGQKIHYSSLFGMAHMPYSAPGSHSHSYEDFFEIIDALDLAPEFRHEAFRRMVFNVLACNMDDHTKNFGFLLSPTGTWELAPAFDVTYANNPQPGRWTATQQMSVMGKRMEITINDLISAGHHCNVATQPKLKEIIEQVVETLQKWDEFAEEAGVTASTMNQIQRAINSRINESDPPAL